MKNLKRILALTAAGVLAFGSVPAFAEEATDETAEETTEEATDETAEEEATDDAAASDLTFDADGVYHAYIGIQTPVYSFRNAWNDANYGKGITDPDTGVEYFNQVTGWDGSTPITKAGTFTDAELAGNGTYTVSVDGLDLAGEFDSQDYMNLIFVSTDIPRDAVEISDVILDVDGMQPTISPIISPEDEDQYVTIAIQNIWNDDLKTIGYYNVPPTSIKVTFTVSGFNYDNAASADTEEVAEDATDDTATDDAAVEEEAATEEVTDAAAEETTEDAAAADTAAVESTSSSNTGLIVGVVVVVIIIIIVVVVVLKKKKN